MKTLYDFKVIRLIKNCLKEADKKNIKYESLIYSNQKGKVFKIIKDDKPYRNIYSHTKSFISLLIGIAIGEEKIKFNTRMVDVLKDEINDEQYKKYYDITVEHLLKMSSGFGESYLMMGHEQRMLPDNEKDYLGFLLSQDLKYTPGTHFTYSNGDTYLLSRILEKAFNIPTKTQLIDKIFKPLDISNYEIEEDGQGRMFGASGLQLNIVDMNKLGILCLNRGVWNNQRIVPDFYFDLINKTMVDNSQNLGDDYSYQFWITKEGSGYRADGAYGQWTFIHKEKGVCISMQRPEDSGDHQMLRLIKDLILAKL